MRSFKFFEVIAAFITIVNSIYAILKGIGPFSFPWLDELIKLKLAIGLRATLTIILELSLASFWGYLMCLLLIRFKNSRPSTIISTTIIALISAWVTFFNIEFILLAGAPMNEIGEYIRFFSFLMGAFAMGAIFILLHFNELGGRVNELFETPRGPIIIQAAAFLVIFISACL